MTKRNRYGDREFQDLAAKINQAIIANDGLIGDQKDQVELVMSLEKKFFFNIKRYQQIKTVYEKFINYITKENGNILSARPYFREKSTVFNAEIGKAIKAGDVDKLLNFDINFKLIQFIVDNWEGKLPTRCQNYYNEFIEARRILIENNLPLAINRAKLFYRKTPRSHLTLIDLINICTYGLIAGVDKFVGEYTRVWRSVCIGRMVGFMIEEYSKTFLRMYPDDKKILYRANALKYRMGIETVEELTKAVNESFEKDGEEGRKIPKLPISEVHIRTLLNGSSHVSADNMLTEDEGNTNSVYDITASSDNVEKNVTQKDAMKQVMSASKDLEVIERKIIRLKGVEL